MISIPVEIFPLTNIHHEEIPLYMSASDVMLLVSDYEASPMVVKEAVACGLPCVCYNVGDVSTVLKGIPRSYAIPPDKKNAAQLVKNILEEPFCERRSYLPEKYATKYVCEKIISVYRNLLKG